MRQAMVLVGVLLVAALSANVYAIGNVGTPTAELKAGQFSVGGDYWYSDIGLDTVKLKGNYQYFDENGDLDEQDVWTEKTDIDKVKTNFYYVTFGYGIVDGWEVFGRVGIADVKGKAKEADEPYAEWVGTNFDNDMAWGVGTRYTFLRQDKISWGVAAQMNWFNTSSTKKTSWVHDDGDGGDELDVATDEVTWDAYDLLIAVGPTVDMGGWKLYGGPFYYMISGDGEWKSREVDTWVDGDETMTDLEVTKLTGDLKEDGSFGGYVGASFPLAQNMDVAVEFAMISGGWAAGTGLTYKF